MHARACAEVGAAKSEKKTEVWAVKTFGVSSMQKSNFPTTLLFLLPPHPLHSELHGGDEGNGLMDLFILSF